MQPPPGAPQPAPGAPQPASPAGQVAPGQPVPRRPPPPQAGAAAAVQGAPLDAQAIRARAASAASRQSVPPPLEGRSVYATKRSRGRTIALVAAAVAVAAAIVVAVIALGGSSGGKPVGSAATTAASRTATTIAKHQSHKAAKPAPKAPTVSPAETTVAVLNATEAEGLAHRTASSLQQNGYSQATALNGKPPGSGQVSVVEYASGHQAEAEAVGRSASIAHVLPIEAAVTALAGSANVVVIVGADKERETSNP
jgi:hypothetical protein